jgi:hypothetical protein
VGTDGDVRRDWAKALCRSDSGEMRKLRKQRLDRCARLLILSSA